MYAPPPAPAARMAGVKNAWPLAAICCLGLLGLLIVITIVLALIPIYLPNKEAQKSNITNTFYVLYSASPSRINESLTGTVTNPATAGTAAGLTSTTGTYSSGQIQASGSRKRRGLITSRQKRASLVNFLFLCTPVFTTGCTGQICRTSVVAALQKTIREKGDFNVTLTILSGGNSSNITYTLKFVAFSSTKPLGFLGEASSFNFTASQSGLFTNWTTWSGGIVPYGNATVIIPAGITVTIAGSIFETLVSVFDIYGTLAVGQGASTFTFAYPTSIIIRSGGTLKDLTTSKSVTITSDTAITLMDGSTSFDSSTSVNVGTTHNKRAIGQILRFSAAPFTCGIINAAGLTFKRITAIARRSGLFLSAFSYLGRFIPSPSICTTSGCGIYVPSGITLSTADLLGILNIRISYMEVASGGTLLLGTENIADFASSYIMQMEIRGIMKFVGTGGKIKLPKGSACNIYSGGSFVSTVVQSVSIITIDVSGAILGAPLTLNTNTLGPYYIDITITGPTFSFTVPAGSPDPDPTGATSGPSVVATTPFMSG